MTDGTNPIEASGLPLAFAMDRGAPPAVCCGGDGDALITTEARLMGGHQKEAVVHEGEGGPRWRFTSDEGKHLKGADVAPFPLGFFNAGIHGDLWANLLPQAAAKKLSLAGAKLSLRNFYWMTGSFTAGTGEGFADPPEVALSLPECDPASANALLAEAISRSAAFDALQRALQNTFALYVNGRRVAPDGVSASSAPDAPDPFVTYAEPPRPVAGWSGDVIAKTGTVEPGEVRPAPASTTSRIIRTVSGHSSLADPAGLSETATWLEMPGVSHFTLTSDVRREGRAAPSGLALLNAGIAFCYLTQLSRYVEHMKLDISGIRLVQSMRFEKAGGSSRAHPADTHLFLNGQAPASEHANLLTIAARTCYLHATLSSTLASRIVGAADVLEPVERRAH